MQKMAKFEKVSYEQFKKDWVEEFGGLTEDIAWYEVDMYVRNLYEKIRLPKRATMQSAGYDFFSPMNFKLEAGQSIKIPTGIKCEMYDGWVLMLYPRSGLGFKYGLGLANHTAIIDSDYFEADNEGHIFVKLVNDSSIAKDITFKAGDAFCQGVFLPFGITLDDNVESQRFGGLGSTGR